MLLAAAVLAGCGPAPEGEADPGYEAWQPPDGDDDGTGEPATVIWVTHDDALWSFDPVERVVSHITDVRGCPRLWDIAASHDQLLHAPAMLNWVAIDPDDGDCEVLGAAINPTASAYTPAGLFGSESPEQLVAFCGGEYARIDPHSGDQEVIGELEGYGWAQDMAFLPDGSGFVTIAIDDQAYKTHLVEFDGADGSLVHDWGQVGAHSDDTIAGLAMYEEVLYGFREAGEIEELRLQDDGTVHRVELPYDGTLPGFGGAAYRPVSGIEPF